MEKKVETLGQKLAQFRKQTDLKQADVAVRIGCKGPTLSKIEKDIRLPSAATLSKLLQLFKNNLQWSESQYRAIYDECFQQLDVSSSSTSKGQGLDTEKVDKVALNFDKYVGTYFIYSFISSGEDRITCRELTITESLNKFAVYMKGEFRGSEFTGELIIREQNLFITLDRTNVKRGRLLYIFYDPPSKFMNKLWGILAGTSVIDEPMAKVVLLSKAPMDDQTLREEFAKNGYTVKNGIWKIPKGINLFTDNNY